MDAFMKSSRLVFFEWKPQDIDLAMKLWGDPQVTQLFDAYGPWPQEKVSHRLHVEITHLKKWGYQYWPVFDRETLDFVGVAGFKPYSEEPALDPSGLTTRKTWAEMGFHLRPCYWGKGLASEAGEAVLKHAYNLSLSHVFAGHHPQNNASARVLNKLGFIYQFSSFYAPTQQNHPGYVYTVKPVEPN